MDLHFLAAKLKSRIGLLAKAPDNDRIHQETTQPANEAQNTFKDSIVMRNPALDLKLDQLSIQNQALERENADLRAKCERHRSDLISSECLIGELRSELSGCKKQLSNACEKSDDLESDANAFDSYLKSLKSDEEAMRNIIQKIQDAFHITKEELSVMTARYAETCCLLRGCTQQLEAFKDQVIALEGRLRAANGEVEHLGGRVGELEGLQREWVAQEQGFKERISRLERSLDESRYRENREGKVGAYLEKILEVSQGWELTVDKLAEEVTQMKAIAEERQKEKMAMRDAEIEKLLLALREKQIPQLSIPDATVQNTQVKASPETRSVRADLEREIQDNNSSNAVNDSSWSGLGKRVMSTSSDTSCTDTDGAIKRIREATSNCHYSTTTSPSSSLLQPAVSDTSKLPASSMDISPTTSTTTRPQNRSGNHSTKVCTVCQEPPYGLMKICQVCRQEFHSSCARQQQKEYNVSFTAGCKAFRCISCSQTAEN